MNYDGKFGLNNMNSYFQNANTETAVVWRDWKYKVGDHILFNDTDRFSLLYNNLKGQIVQIELFDSRIIWSMPPRSKMLASSRRCYFDKRKENTMAFDIMNLFEETENVITELDGGNELAAVDFANRINTGGVS